MLVIMLMIMMIQCVVSFKYQHHHHNIHNQHHHYNIHSQHQHHYHNQHQQLRMQQQTQMQEEVWTVRRKMIRQAVKPQIKYLIKEKNEKLEKGLTDNDIEEKKKKENFETTGLVTTFFVIVGAAVARIGGRAAFASILGLDAFVESGFINQINDFITWVQSLGPLSYIGFLGCWIIAKTLCIDALSIVLAFSSGVLFGGLIEGTILSVVCSTIASIIGFYLSRIYLKDFVAKKLQDSPLLRAISKSISKEGFKTVFTLRLSPLLPIPIGAYNYIYGASSVSAIDFISGISLASIKPMLLDSYLGIFGKSIIDADNSQSDVVFIAVIVAIFAAGTFGTQVAASTLEDIKKEANELTETIDKNAMKQKPFYSTMQMIGLTDDNIPKFLIGIKTGLENALYRINTVIDDEWVNVTDEENSGVDVDSLIDWNGMRKQPLDSIDPNLYPGKRILNDFETKKLNDNNFMDYTYESMVFSFALLAALGKPLDEDNEKASNVVNT